MSRAGEARALVERAVADLGGLDVLVNAASAGFEPKAFEAVSEKDLDAALRATVKEASWSRKLRPLTCACHEASS